jgi:type IV secretion system protein VirB4
MYGDHPAAWYPHLTGSKWPAAPEDLPVWLEAAE